MAIDSRRCVRANLLRRCRQRFGTTASCPFFRVHRAESCSVAGRHFHGKAKRRLIHGTLLGGRRGLSQLAEFSDVVLDIIASGSEVVFPLLGNWRGVFAAQVIDLRLLLVIIL